MIIVISSVFCDENKSTKEKNPEGGSKKINRDDINQMNFGGLLDFIVEINNRLRILEDKNKELKKKNIELEERINKLEKKSYIRQIKEKEMEAGQSAKTTSKSFVKIPNMDIQIHTKSSNLLISFNVSVHNEGKNSVAVVGIFVDGERVKSSGGAYCHKVGHIMDSISCSANIEVENGDHNVELRWYSTGGKLINTSFGPGYGCSMRVIEITK